MSIAITVIIFIILFLLGIRPITALILCFLVFLLCDIDITKEYYWYSGIWHGIFFVPNYIRHIFSDSPFKAEIYTTAYNIFYWIFSILSVLSFFGGRDNPNRRY